MEPDGLGVDRGQAVVTGGPHDRLRETRHQGAFPVPLADDAHGQLRGPREKRRLDQSQMSGHLPRRGDGGVGQHALRRDLLGEPVGIVHDVIDVRVSELVVQALGHLDALLRPHRMDRYGVEVDRRQAPRGAGAFARHLGKTEPHDLLPPVLAQIHHQGAVTHVREDVGAVGRP